MMGIPGKLLDGKLRSYGKRLRDLVKKLTLIDFIVMVVVLGGLFLSFTYLSRERETIYLHTVSEFEDYREDPYPPFYWFSNSIAKGDVVYGVAGERVAEVVGVENTEWGGQRRYSRLRLKVENALFDRRTRQYRIGDTTLQVGSDITLDVGTTRYNGVISYVGKTQNPPSDQYKYMNLYIKVPNVPPWLAQTYNSSFVVANTEGKEVFSILDSEIVPAEKSVDTADGRIVRAKDPYFKDVFLTARVWVRCQEEVCYFNEVRPVKVGEFFWVQSKESIIEGSARIIKVEESN